MTQRYSLNSYGSFELLKHSNTNHAKEIWELYCSYQSKNEDSYVKEEDWLKHYEALCQIGCLASTPLATAFTNFVKEASEISEMKMPANVLLSKGNKYELNSQSKLKDELFNAIINYQLKGDDDDVPFEYRPTVFEFPWITTYYNPYNSESTEVERIVLIESTEDSIILAEEWGDTYTEAEVTRYIKTFTISRNSLNSTVSQIFEIYQAHKKRWEHIEDFE